MHPMQPAILRQNGEIRALLLPLTNLKCDRPMCGDRIQPLIGRRDATPVISLGAPASHYHCTVPSSLMVR